MQARQSAYQREQKKEGEVTVENTQQHKTQRHFDQGEYVDFEEIDWFQVKIKRQKVNVEDIPVEVVQHGPTGYELSKD